MGHFSQPQWPSWTFSGLGDTFPTYAQLSNYPAYLADSMDAYQAHHSRHLVHHHQMSRATESKPRLSKEEVEVLEAEFQKNHKPSSSTKKALAESMRVDNARINNWFQNRRAREKKENNIREYEAKQRLEKELAEAESGHQLENSRQSDLVASSAPFPELPTTSSRPRAPVPPSPSVQSVPDASSETTEPSQPGDTASPLLLPTHSRPVTPTNRETSSLELEPDNDMVAGELSEHVDGYFGMPCGLPLEQSEQYLSMDTKAPSQFLNLYHGFTGTDLGRPDTEGPEQQQQQGLTTAAADDLEANSPEPADIASRRNRRPAPLTIIGGRGHSSYTLRSASELDSRAERGSPMRRVASTAGSARVKKAVATPRSPFYEAKADLAFHTSRSPSTTNPAATRAPPTPDTPVALHQSGSMDARTAISYPLDAKYVSADLALQDPTLRTPPTTPGLMDSVFGMGSGYDMPVSEEALISPALGRLPGDFDMSAMAGGLSGYVDGANSCSNQRATSLLSPAQMGPTYFGSFLGLGANAEYQWPDVSDPTSPSAGLGPAHRGGYMNMT